MINILLSVRQPWSGLIMDGKKTWELRKSFPHKYYYEKLIVWLYESGKGGERAIIGKCVLRTIWDIREDISDCFTREILEKACVTYDLLKSYAPNYVWEFSSLVSTPSPVPLSAIGLTRPPQSWQYLTPEQAAILEQAAYRECVPTAKRDCPNCKYHDLFNDK